jgi:diphthamide biosynthesis methyltransferase
MTQTQTSHNKDKIEQIREMYKKALIEISRLQEERNRKINNILKNIDNRQVSLIIKDINSIQ